MAYVKTLWKDEIPASPYHKITRFDGTPVETAVMIELTAEPIEIPTPLNARNLNHMEVGIEEAHVAAETADQKAVTAQGLATLADEKATTAEANATTALNRAVSAGNTAENAQTIAASASSSATAALASAGNALTIARSKTVEIPITGMDESMVSGNGRYWFPVPHTLHGWNLVRAEAALMTRSTGAAVVNCHRFDDAGASVVMLSTYITIDANEWHSYTAGTPSVVNPAGRTVASGNRLRVDTVVNGTAGKGLFLILEFQAP